MPDTVWINGSYVSHEDARVGAFDASVQHAIALFETMLATNGRIFRIEKHMSRLENSARELGLSDQLRTSRLAEAAEMVVAKSELAEGDSRARVRLTLTGGDLNLLSGGGGGNGHAVDPTIIISVQRATEYPPEFFDDGVTISIADARANPLNPTEGHKTINYWWRLRELQAAAAKRASEALVLQVTNHVVGGTVSNVFAVKDGELVTPPAHGEEGGGSLPSPVLPGITRDAVIEFAEQRGVRVLRRLMTIADVLDADEVFLTNSSWGVLPVVHVEGKTIGEGFVGDVTKVLRSMWLRAVREEA